MTTAGVAKGSGMIHPNMATMLAFITCDANISTQTLQQALSEIVQITFNQITVMEIPQQMIWSLSCQTDVQIIKKFYLTHLTILSLKLCFSCYARFSKKIAKDGEGATKLIEVNVTGAQNSESARMIAKCIVGSSLVKTAIFGEDPNWGRIIAKRCRILQ